MSDSASDPGRFGHDNVDASVEGNGIITISFDSRRTLARAGELNSQGKVRSSDLIASSRGFIRVGPCRISLNVLRA